MLPIDASNRFRQFRKLNEIIVTASNPIKQNPDIKRTEPPGERINVCKGEFSHSHRLKHTQNSSTEHFRSEVYELNRVA